MTSTKYVKGEGAGVGRNDGEERGLSAVKRRAQTRQDGYNRTNRNLQAIKPAVLAGLVTAVAEAGAAGAEGAAAKAGAGAKAAEVGTAAAVMEAAGPEGSRAYAQNAGDRAIRQ